MSIRSIYTNIIDMYIVQVEYYFIDYERQGK